MRTYCPVGDLVAGMAYLVRRLLENTSNESFLYEQARGVPLEVLLAPPLTDGVRVLLRGGIPGLSRLLERSRADCAMSSAL